MPIGNSDDDDVLYEPDTKDAGAGGGGFSPGKPDGEDFPGFPGHAMGRVDDPTDEE